MQPQNGGQHLAKGRYAAGVDKLCLKYPNLQYSDTTRPLGATLAASRVIALEFFPGKEPTRTEFGDIHSLQEHFRQRPTDTNATRKRRLYMLEGLDPLFLGILGEELDIDPNLILRHQRTAIWENGHESGNTPCLPLLDPAKIFSIVYYELRYFPQVSHGSLSWRSANDCRHISLSRLGG